MLRAAKIITFFAIYYLSKLFKFHKYLVMTVMRAFVDSRISKITSHDQLVYILKKRTKTKTQKKHVKWWVQERSTGTSLVAQWLRIHLPVQWTQVRALVREDPTCRGATKPVHHNYWACALEPTSHNYWAHVPQLLKPARLESVLHNKRSHHNEKPTHCNEE